MPRPTGPGSPRPPGPRPYERRPTAGPAQESPRRPNPIEHRPEVPRPVSEGVPPPVDHPRPQRPFPRPQRPWERRDATGGPTRPSFPAAEAAGLLAEGEELVAGRHPVEEAFVAGRPARRLLVVPHRRDALERIVLHATSLRIPIVEIEGGTLTALAGFDGHQGIALVVAGRRFASLDEVLARAIERGEPPFVLVLDSLEDPQNLGSLLRSAEAAGVHGVLFPTRRQAPLTPAAVKASAGAVEHLLLVPVDDLTGALADLHVRGVRIVGAEADAALTHREADLRGPVALVVGHEGQGLGSAVRRRCDFVVRIPMRGRIESLNAAVAGSILLFEASGQRGEAPPPRERRAAEPDGSEHDGPEEVLEVGAEAITPPAEPAAPDRAPAESASAQPAATEPDAGADPAAPVPRRAKRKTRTTPTEPDAGAEGLPAAGPSAEPAPAEPAAPETEPDAGPDALAPAPRRAKRKTRTTPAEPEAAPEGPPADGDALLPGVSAPAAAGDGASGAPHEPAPPKARRARPPRA